MARLWLLIEERFGFRPERGFFWTVVEDFARQNRTHPVRQYLDALTWDGKPRIDTWLTVYGGAGDTEYVRNVGKLMLVAAVRRVQHPGCKFDELLVLESRQGTDKSSALAIIAVNPDWFSDDLPLNAEPKRVIEAVRGRWIIETAELSGLRRGDVEDMKALLSRQRDSARMSYDRLETDAPRQCVFVGTTNATKYLRDATGNRRFWPVKVEAFDLAALARDRDQLWAEAATCEARGDSIRLAPSLYPKAAAEQEERRIEDPWVEALADHFQDQRCKVRAEDVWSLLGVEKDQRTQNHNERFGAVMDALGFKRTRLRFDGKLEYAYVRGDDPPEAF